MPRSLEERETIEEDLTRICQSGMQPESQHTLALHGLLSSHSQLTKPNKAGEVEQQGKKKKKGAGPALMTTDKSASPPWPRYFVETLSDEILHETEQ